VGAGTITGERVWAPPQPSFLEPYGWLPGTNRVIFTSDYGITQTNPWLGKWYASQLQTIPDDLSTGPTRFSPPFSTTSWDWGCWCNKATPDNRYHEFAHFNGDGKVYTSIVNSDGASGAMDVWSYNADGTGRTRVSFFGGVGANPGVQVPGWPAPRYVVAGGMAWLGGRWIVGLAGDAQAKVMDACGGHRLGRHPVAVYREQPDDGDDVAAVPSDASRSPVAAPGDLWVVGASHTAWTGQPVTQNMPRALGLGSGGTLLTTTNQWLVGGLVVPAGRAVSNVNCVYSGAGSGSVTIRHAAVLDTATRTVRAHSVNSTALATGEVVTTYAMVTPWTPDYDTPVWVMLSHNQATTLPTIRTGPNGTSAPNLLAPALAAHNGTASSATVPTDGSTVITAPTTGLANVPYIWLT
jgi:hypothetical protein